MAIGDATSDSATAVELSDSAARRRQNDPAVSVIIPAFNEERYIVTCLESLSRQRAARESFEVILVDNGSIDQTIELARSFAPSLNLTILRKDGVRISALRNLGAAHARGHILAFVDADCAAPASWLEEVMARFPRNEFGVLGAFYRIPDNSTWVARIWSRYQKETKQGQVSYVPAGNLLVTRERFFEIGGFDEAIQTNEDYEFCRRMRKAGSRAIAAPAVAVVHYGTPQTLRAFFHQQRWHGTHVLKVFLRKDTGSGNTRAVGFAFFTLLCEAAVLLGLLKGTFQESWGWLGIALGVVLLPPVALSLLRIRRAKLWLDIWPLTLLYLIYGVARSTCLLWPGPRARKKPMPPPRPEPNAA